MIHYNYIGKIQLTVATTAERMAHVPMLAEPVWDEEQQYLYMGDGVTAGGIPVSSSASEVEQEITDLQIALNNEIQARIDGDVQLAEDLQNEINARSVAIQDVLDALANEASERIAADGTLQTNINLKANTADLSDVAFSGSYDDLTDKPVIPTVPVLSVAGKTGNVTLVKADVGLGNVDNTSDLNKPISNATQDALDEKVDIADLADVATSGSYNDLLNRPTLGTAAATDSTAYATAAQGATADTAVQPDDLADVATTGSYNDLTDTPTIPAAQVQTDWNATSGIASIANKPNLATVATSGSYNDLSDKPTIAGQVNSDWNATSGVEEILNKPTTLAGYGITDAINVSQKGAINGVAALGSDGKVPSTQLPDNNVLSVNGQTGVVVLDKGDVGLGNVDNTSDLNKPISTATQSALNAKQDAFGSQAANVVYAAPNGSTGLPAFRSLVAADIPSLSSSYVVNGRIVNAGTGLTGGGSLAADRTISLSSQSITSLALADTAVQPSSLAPVATAGTFASLTSTPTTLSGYGITDAINSSEKGAANGVATLGADSKIPSSQLPPIAISETFVVADEAAQLALTVQRGDIAVRTDLSKSYINSTGNNTSMSDWTELLSPPNDVVSVNGQTGVVVLDADDIGLGNVDNTSDLNKPISTATQTALNGKQDSFTSQTANTVFAAPNGSNGLPTFRSLVASDIPNLSSSYVVPSRTVSAGTGLTGGGDLSVNRTISLNATTIASLDKADSAIQTLTAGTNITIDNTDPKNPIISSTGSGGGGSWGTITGTLSDQTDLQTALNAKANTSSLATVATSGLFADLLSKPTTLSGYGITDAVPNTLTVTAGNGVTGGGTLSGNITLTLGTPSTLTAATTNAVTSTSHTHAITGFLALTGGTMTGAIIGPNGSNTSASFATRAAGYGMYSSAADYLDFTSNGGRILALQRGEAGVNTYVKMVNYNVTDGNYGPDITVEGTPNNISMFLQAKGTGRVVIGNGNNSEAHSFTSDSSGWSGFNIAGTGATLKLESAGSNAAFMYVAGGNSTNVEIDIAGKGSSGVALMNGNSQGIYTTGTATVSRITAVHSATNANLEIGAKGTGVVNVLSDLTLSGTGVGRMASVTANATTTIGTTHLNCIIKKTNTTAYTYTIPSALGSDDDTVTVVNAGSAGDITVAGSGVTLYSGGTAGSVTVGPYSTRTFVRISSTIWVA